MRVPEGEQLFKIDTSSLVHSKGARTKSVVVDSRYLQAIEEEKNALEQGKPVATTEVALTASNAKNLERDGVDNLARELELLSEQIAPESNLIRDNLRATREMKNAKLIAENEFAKKIVADFSSAAMLRKDHILKDKTVKPLGKNKKVSAKISNTDTTYTEKQMVGSTPKIMTMAEAKRILDKKNNPVQTIFVHESASQLSDAQLRDIEAKKIEVIRKHKQEEVNIRNQKEEIRKTRFIADGFQVAYATALREVYPQKYGKVSVEDLVFEKPPKVTWFSRNKTKKQSLNDLYNKMILAVDVADEAAGQSTIYKNALKLKENIDLDLESINAKDPEFLKVKEQLPNLRKAIQEAEEKESQVIHSKNITEGLYLPKEHLAFQLKAGEAEEERELAKMRLQNEAEGIEYLSEAELQKQLKPRDLKFDEANIENWYIKDNEQLPEQKVESKPGLWGKLKSGLKGIFSKSK